MRDLDTRAQGLMKNIDSLAEEFLEGIIQGSSFENRKEQKDEIQQHFNKAKEYGDDKVYNIIVSYRINISQKIR